MGMTRVLKNINIILIIHSILCYETTAKRILTLFEYKCHINFVCLPNGGIYHGKGKSFPTLAMFFVCIRSNVEHNFIIDSQH